MIVQGGFLRKAKKKKKRVIAKSTHVVRFVKVEHPLELLSDG
jgi:hypothetical protein